MAVSTLNDLELGKIDHFIGQHQVSALAIVFTDIQGFTEMTEMRGDTYSSRLRRIHDKLIDESIQNAFGGIVVKHCGDSAMGVFTDPMSAVLSALNIQKVLREFNANKPDGILDDIQVRIGLHFGTVSTEMQLGRNPDVFGRHVNRTSRIEALTSGGQIYVSKDLYEKVKDANLTFAGEPVAWSYHGKFTIKGLSEGIDIYEVTERAFQNTHRPPKNGNPVSEDAPGSVKKAG